MADSKWSEQKEEHPGSKTKSYQPRNTNIDVKKHLTNLLETPLKSDKPITKIINSQLDIKLGEFIHKELKIKSRKEAGLKKYLQKYERQGNLMNSSILQRRILREYMREMDQRLHPPFPKERWPQITKNYGVYS